MACGDWAGLQRLVRYMARPAVSFERVSYDASKGLVTVRSAKKRGGVRPVVATYHVMAFLALLVVHVPPARMHMTRYYGWYASRARAKRRASSGLADGQGGSAAGDGPKVLPPSARERRLRWAQLIRLVLEVDPLQCSRCGGQMKIISFVQPTQPAVIERILTHLGLWTDDGMPRSTGPPRWLQIEQARAYLAAHPEHDPQWDGSRDGPADDTLDQRAQGDDEAYHDQRSWA